MTGNDYVRYAKNDLTLATVYTAFKNDGISMKLQFVDKGLFKKGYLLAYESETAEVKAAKTKACVTRKDLLTDLSTQDEKTRNVVTSLYERDSSRLTIGCAVVIGIVLVLGMFLFWGEVPGGNFVLIGAFIGVCIATALNMANEIKKDRYAVDGIDMWQEKDVEAARVVLGDGHRATSKTGN